MNTRAQRITYLKNTLKKLQEMQDGSGKLQVVLDVSTCPSMEKSVRIELSGISYPLENLFEELKNGVAASLVYNIKEAKRELKELEDAIK